MKEEEVDQYYKNKFDQFSATPAPDAWARLQNKLEPPVQKRPTMWLYYAAAAITLLLLSGGLMFWLQTGPNGSEQTLAQLKPIKPAVISKLTEQPTLAAVNPDKLEEIKTPEAINNQWNIANTDNKGPITNSGTKPTKKKIRIKPGILIARNNQPGSPARKNSQLPETLDKAETYPTGEQTSSALASTNSVGGNIMEVVIKKDPIESTASVSQSENSTMEEVIKEDLNRKGRLVKNIFKQARNLKNGEKVELSTLGFSANYRIDVESKILKHKYTKVINL